MKRFRLIIEDRKDKKTMKFVDTDTVMGVYSNELGATAFAHSDDTPEKYICAIASMQSECEYLKRHYLTSVPAEQRAEAEEYMQKAIDKAMWEVEQQEAKDE